MSQNDEHTHTTTERAPDEERRTGAAAGTTGSEGTVRVSTEAPEAAHHPPPSDEDVESILRGVVDPELHGDVVELGMYRGADISEEGHVTVRIALTISSCPLRGEIKDEVASKVRGLPGVTGVDVEYSEMDSDERSALMQKVRWRAREQAPETEVPLDTRIVAISSGKGGVGKSSVTVNLGLALAARGFTVGVLDADIWGFSVPRMLGLEGRLTGEDGKIHPNTLDVPAAANAASGQPGLLKVVSMGFLVEEEDSALMWRGLLLSKALEQFLVDVRWGEMDYLLVDMPPGTGDIQMSLSRLLPRTEMAVVTTPNQAAQRVAARVVDMARRSYLKVLGVIENMSAFECEHGEAYPLFGEGGGGELATQIGVPLLGEVPLDPRLSAGADAGRPIVLEDPDAASSQAIARVADRMVDDLLPPLSMEGCSARLFEAMDANLERAEQVNETAVSEPTSSS